VHAHLAQLAPEVGGEEVVAVDLGGARSDLGLGEGARTASRSAAMSSPSGKVKVDSNMGCVSCGSFF
jgi:hypothetical protein